MSMIESPAAASAVAALNDIHKKREVPLNEKIEIASIELELKKDFVIKNVQICGHLRMNRMLTDPARLPLEIVVTIPMVCL